MTSKGFLYFICAVSAMGGLLFGYDWVVIGGAKPFYEQYFGIAQSPVMQGVAMTTALVGVLGILAAQLINMMLAQDTTVAESQLLNEVEALDNNHQGIQQLRTFMKLMPVL